MGIGFTVWDVAGVGQDDEADFSWSQSNGCLGSVTVRRGEEVADLPAVSTTSVSSQMRDSDPTFVWRLAAVSAVQFLSARSDRSVPEVLEGVSSVSASDFVPTLFRREGVETEGRCLDLGHGVSLLIPAGAAPEFAVIARVGVSLDVVVTPAPLPDELGAAS